MQAVTLAAETRKTLRLQLGEVGLLLKSLLSVCESRRDSLMLTLEQIETEQKTVLCMIVSLREGSMWRLVVHLLMKRPAPAHGSFGACEVCQARRESSPGGASVLFMTDG